MCVHTHTTHTHPHRVATSSEAGGLFGIMKRNQPWCCGAWRLCSQFSGVPPAREEGGKRTASSAVDSAVIGISISICPSDLERSCEARSPGDFLCIAGLHLSAGISLPLPAYCCKCVSHLAAVCRHMAHLSPGPLLYSPPKKQRPLFTRDGLIGSPVWQ